MAIITINIPANITNRVIDGFAKRYAYAPTLEDGTANPETKTQFAKRKLIEFIKQSVREAEIQDATNAAATTAAASADTDIQLT